MTARLDVPFAGFARLALRVPRAFAAFAAFVTLASLIVALTAASTAFAQEAPRVVDIPTRAGVTQRFLLIAPAAPKAVAVLYAGGHGGLRIAANGAFGWGRNNFLVRARQAFVDDGVAVAIVDAPSDRLTPPYLGGFRETPEHAADARAVIAWLRAQPALQRAPVWLIGTSRGTQSVAAIAVALAASGGGPDGIVLTSTILREGRANYTDKPVPDLDLGAIKIPALVVHHEDDACKLCPAADTNALMAKFAQSPRTKLMIVSGGVSQGDACEAFAHHGYNGIESETVHAITAWMLAP